MPMRSRPSPDWIASLQNPAIKQIRALSERKARDETGLFFVDGVRMATEAAHADAEVEVVVVAPELLTDPRGLDVARELVRRGARHMEVAASVMLGLSRRANPKGLAAVVRQRWISIDDLVLGPDRFALALAGVADPGNLGTILRTCDASGAAAVVLLGSATDPHHPTALSASTGAIFSQSLVRTSLHHFTTWTREHGYAVVGSAPDAEQDYRAAPYARPLLLLMGNESVGLSKAERSACDLLVRIPMAGRVESLNLAVATGLLLYELFDRVRTDR